MPKTLNNISNDKEIKRISRIKLILVEQQKTGRWLANELGKDPMTVSKKWTNTAQPSLEMLLKIADALKVDVTELLNPSWNDEAKSVM